MGKIALYGIGVSKYAIVLKNGSQVMGYSPTGTYFITEGEKCENPLNELALFPNAKKLFNLCFPVVDKKDEPKLYVNFAYNFEITEKREYREYSFDLTPYLKS